jgi:hypothetical protein
MLRPVKTRTPRDAPTCQKCSTKMLPIVYGEPTPETEAARERGEVALGGCRVRGDGSDTRWRCRACGAES